MISVTADIGIVGYVDADVPSPAYINQHIALVRFEGTKVCSKFVAYFLATEDAQRRFRAATDNGTKAGMNLMEVQSLQLLLPARPEQQRIASCLSSLDRLISAEAQKFAALKIHRKLRMAKDGSGSPWSDCYVRVVTERHLGEPDAPPERLPAVKSKAR